MQPTPSDMDDRGFSQSLGRVARSTDDRPAIERQLIANTDFRNCLILAIVVGTLWLACNPFANVAVNDDFTYAFTVKRLVETHRFTFNGWGTAMLGAQALWAWPFVMAFGFSHDALRFSVLPWSVACAWLAYALHRRFSIAPIWSLFAALLLVASPIFTPWSASFMTDVPGLALILAMLLTFVALRSATSIRRVATFSILFALLGILAGSVRQSAIPLAAVAYAFELWQRRRDRRAFVVVLGVAVACGTCMAAMLRWASTQNYYVPEVPPQLSMMPLAFGSLFRLFLDGVLYGLPLLLALVPIAVPRLRTRAIALVGPTIVIGVALVSHARIVRAPWTGNTLMPTGMLEDWIDAPGHRPIVIGDALRVALAACVTWMVALGCMVVDRDGIGWLKACGRRPRGIDPLRSAMAGILVVGFAYLCLLVPRAPYRLVFDRYLLVVIPIASLGLCYGLRDRLARARPALAAWVLLGLFAVGGAAITFDHFAELRARSIVTNLLAGEGIPRTEIVDSIGFNAWTQLEATGHMNNERMLRPPGAFAKDPLAEQKMAIYPFLPQMPAITPHWLVMNIRTGDEIRPSDRLFKFTTLLPPRQRVLVIRQIAWPPVDRVSSGR